MVVLFLLAYPIPTFTLGIGTISLKSTFSEHGHFAFIKFKGITNCKPHGSKYSAPPRPLGIGSKGQKSTFSKHCHVSYPIKGNNERSFACRTPPPWGWTGSIGQNSTFFQKMVMLHIKLYGIMKCSNMVANILSADPHPPRP